LIGASIHAIKVAEDRQLFKDAMRSIGLDVPQSGLARSPNEAMDLARTLGFPIVIRPSFTLGASVAASRTTSKSSATLRSAGSR
jgi:carbamoyl-phosphate synthase large subunit